jgi:hypothetical protein
MPLTFPAIDPTEFEPERTINQECRRVVIDLPASEVVVVYYSKDGTKASLRPIDGDQRSHHFKVFAPGLSPLAVERVRFSDLDYTADERAMVEITFVEYKKGEHVAKPEDEAKRLELIAAFNAANTVSG